MRWRWISRLTAPLALLWWLGSPAGAQTQPAGSSSSASISGVVMDIDWKLPLEGAVVELRVADGSGSEADTGTPLRRTTSDESGRYTFSRLMPGRYEVIATHLGYRRFAVQVELLHGSSRHLSMGLNVLPIALAEVEARVDQPAPYLRVDSLAGTVTGLAADQGLFPGRRSLAADQRVVTSQFVSETVTLGQQDLFRSLQRSAGVSTRSDYTADLWTRGSPWHETRVYFDGVAIFNPLHGFGSFSGVSASSAGAVVFHPGVRPAALGEGTAGVLDFWTRPGSGDGRVNLNADLSLVSAGLAMDQQVGDGKLAWMLAGRRTYIDWLTSVTSRAVDRPELRIPFAFADLTGRADLALTKTQRLELSAIRSLDRLTTAEGDRARWGSTAARISHVFEGERLAVRHTVGASRYEATALGWDTVEELVDLSRLPIYGWESESLIDYQALSGVVQPVRSGAGPVSLSFGYDVLRQAVQSRGGEALPLPASLRISEWPYPESSSLLLGAGWVDQIWANGPLTVQSGLRVEGGSAVRDGGRLRMAPRLTVGYEPNRWLHLSTGFGRTYQYTQAIAPTGVQLASLSSSHVWVLAGEQMPPLRSDLVTVAARVSPDPAAAFTATVFERRSAGVASADPRPGPLFDRLPWVIGSGTARGLELSLDWRGARWGGSGSYTYSSSTSEAADLRFRSATDQTHVLDVTTAVRLAPAWTGRAAFSAATGVPFTRVYGVDIGCAEALCEQRPVPWVGAPNEARSPTYASLDLALEWSRRVGGAEWFVFMQLRNVLNRENGTIYTGGASDCSGRSCDPRVNPADRFERGLPRLPVLGVSVRR